MILYCVRKRKLRVTELPFNSVDWGGREWVRGKLRDSSELFRSIVTLITGDRLHGSNPSIDKRSSIKVPPPISCSRAKNGRASGFGRDFGSSLFHHDRWIARWARGVSLGLSSATVDRVSSCMCRTVWRILKLPLQIPPVLSLLLAVTVSAFRSFRYSSESFVVLVQLTHL